MKTSDLAKFVLLFTLIAGCEAPEMSDSPVAVADQSDSAPSSESKSNVPNSKVEHPEWYLPDGRLDMSGIDGEPPMTTSVPREIHWKDPKQGKLTRRRGGKALGTPLKAIAKAKNETMFNMIKHNLNIYDADKGHFPKTQEEFMDVFLKQYYPAALPLPELEAGDEYFYDPEDHLLKIYRPDA